MSTKIRTLEDLAKISGTAAAELGLKKRIEKNEASKIQSPIKKETTQKPIKVRKPIKNVTDEVEKVVDRMLTYEELFPVDFKALRQEPHILHKKDYNISRKEIQKFIDGAAARSARFEKIYNRRLIEGDNSRGFKIVSINILRKAEAFKEYLDSLDQVEEKLDG